MKTGRNRANEKWRAKHVDRYKQHMRDYYQKTKEKQRIQQRERNAQISKGVKNWYNNIVTGHLPYYFGEEKFEVNRNGE